MSESDDSLRTLDAQLRELVRTQQRLFLSERENSRQLARLESLTAFGIAATALRDPAAVCERAASIVFEHFPFEQSVAFVMEDGALVPVVTCAVEGLAGESAARFAEWKNTPLAWDSPAGGGGALFAAASALTASAELLPALACLNALFGPCSADVDPPTLILPLAGSGAEPAGLMVFRRVTRTLSYHDELPTKSGLAFLSLLARHVAVTLGNGRLVRGLEASYEELARAQATLVGRERLAALGELAAQVAHEVRNPLGAMFNALTLMQPLLPKDGKHRRLVRILEEEAARINDIVAELLEFARPSSPAREQQPLLPIVDAAIDALRAAHPQAVVRVDAASELPLVRVDARMIRQALVNLLTNAAQASDKGTPIDVRMFDTDDALRIEVANVGQSIPSASLERVFEPFFTTKATGTGLGLSVVKRAVDAHAGQLTVTSTEGQATVFTIVLPLV